QLIVVFVLVLMTVALVAKRVSPAVGVVGALLTLYLVRIVDAAVAFSGFSNPAPLTVAALYVVAAGVERSGALLPALRLILGGRSPAGVLTRLSISVSVLSALVANTPVVAMLLSPVRAWADRAGTAPSKVLLPLSYAAIIGGNLTVIGTSTTLVASGMMEQAGLQGFSFWEPARLGLPVAAASLALLIVLAPRLMPDRGRRAQADGERDGGTPEYMIKPFVVSLSVDRGGPLDGVSVADGGLRALPSTYLVGLERDGQTMAPVAPGYRLQGGDVLTFAGRLNQVLDIDRFPGLSLQEHRHVWALNDGQHAWYEAIIGPGSRLVGRTIKQAGFRQRYQAAVVALNRSGETVNTKLGEARLQVGDSLLLVSDLGFRDRWRRTSDFLFIHQRSEAPPTAQAKAPMALAILLAVVAIPLLGVAEVLYAAVVGAAAMVAAGVLTVGQAREAISLNVVTMIAAAIGIGATVEQTGLAATVADGMSGLAGDAGLLGSALSLVVATLVLTELISNAGAVSLMLPVALATAVEAGGDPRRFALGVTLTAASSFLTPIGYQTNTMVFGPGRYQPADFLRLGVPLSLLVLVMAPLFMATTLPL
ncbi:MAG: SLC13 family permease, partial [Acidimicrobiia bacterium]|nr:SLC13 family permease [Acidimicrobiia bacterium]